MEVPIIACMEILYQDYISMLLLLWCEGRRALIMLVMASCGEKRRGYSYGNGRSKNDDVVLVCCFGSFSWSTARERGVVGRWSSLREKYQHAYNDVVLCAPLGSGVVEEQQKVVGRGHPPRIYYLLLVVS